MACLTAKHSRASPRYNRRRIRSLVLLLLLSNSVVSSFTLTPRKNSYIFSPTTVPTRIYAEKAQVRFSNSLSTTNIEGGKDANPLDAVLSWIISDIGSIVLGSIGLMALLVGRLAMDSGANDTPDPAETRENLLVVLAIGGVLLNGLSQLDVESAIAPAVELEGVITTTLPTDENSNDSDMATIEWVLQSVQLQDAVCSAVVLRRQDSEWKIVGGSGILPQRQSPPGSPTLLLDKAVAETEKETSMPNLQALPSKQELVNVLPANTQAAMLIPCRNDDNSLLILGSNRARSFTPKDIAWCKAAASRL